MPGAAHVGVSQRIESEEERERLKRVVSEYCDDLGGFIIRTAAEGASDAEMAQDAAFLKRLWNKVLERRGKRSSKSMLYGELGLAQRILRDFVGTELDTIRVDSRAAMDALREFTEEFVPELTEKLELYTGEQPIFDMYDTETKSSVHWIVRSSSNPAAISSSTRRKR